MKPLQVNRGRDDTRPMCLGNVCENGGRRWADGKQLCTLFSQSSVQVKYLTSPLKLISNKTYLDEPRTLSSRGIPRISTRARIAKRSKHSLQTTTWLCSTSEAEIATHAKNHYPIFQAPSAPTKRFSTATRRSVIAGGRGSERSRCMPTHQPLLVADRHWTLACSVHEALWTF